MLIALSTPSPNLAIFLTNLGLAQPVHSERTGVDNHLALMAPCWGFFVAFTLHLQERR